MRRLLVSACLAVLPCHLLTAQLPTIEAKTAGLEKRDGFLPLYWDAAAGKLWLEIPRLDEELIYRLRPTR